MAMTHKQRVKQVTIPTRFEPKFWRDQDSYSKVVRRIRKKLADIKRDTGVESVQQHILAERATFICISLETQEVEAFQSGKFDAGVYIQAVNSLLGILKTLGLKKHAEQVMNLKTYVKGKRSA